MAQYKSKPGGARNEQEHCNKGHEIFVGGLARDVTESMIWEMFSPYGEIVELRMMTDQSGTSKGFCFVRFATVGAANKAKKEKDGIMFHGKKIGVAPSSDQDSLFFGNLRKDWRPEQFEKFVRQAFKEVVSVDLAMPSTGGSSPGGKKLVNRGFAFVQFSSHAIAGRVDFINDPCARLLTQKQAAARAFRIGSKPDFLLGGDWHPVIDWTEKEPKIDPEELAKIKVAFVGNLPKNADEEFLKKLFEPLGKVERIAMSRKSHFPVGFVHFTNRSDLDNAIKVMDGKTVQGPRKGPDFKIQVAVAKPVEKDRKRARDEAKNQLQKAGSRSDSLNDDHAWDSQDHKSKAPRLDGVMSDAADPYEAAVIALPSAVKERLLRVFHLGMATIYDVDIQCISNLKELPELAAIAVLDQFVLSGADKHDKGAYFDSLVAKYQDKLGLRYNSSHLPSKVSPYAPKGSELLGVRAPSRVQAIDHSVARHSSYTPSASLYSYPSSLADEPPLSRSSLGKQRETGPLYRDSYEYGTGRGTGSRLALSAERPHERPQVKFDPFTGQPYKFDPFTGELIQKEAYTRRS